MSRAYRMIGNPAADQDLTRAYAISERLVEPLILLPAVDTHLRISADFISLLIDKNDLPRALKIGLDALNVARRYESLQFGTLRERREYLFGLTVTALAQTDRRGDLVGLITADLSAEAENSACDSAAMVLGAAMAVEQALRRHDNAELRAVGRRLDVVGWRHFGGTAAGAELRDG